MEGRPLSRQQIESLHKHFPGRAVRMVPLGKDRSMDQAIPLESLAVLDVDDAEARWRILSGDGTLQGAQVEAGNSEDVEDDAGE